MINFQPANPQEQPQLAVNPANLRRRRALAEALAASAPKTVQNTGQGLAMMGMQAAGGFLDGMNERREQAAEQQRRAAQAQALSGTLGELPAGLNGEQFRALAASNPDLAKALATKILDSKLNPPEQFDQFTDRDGRTGQVNRKTNARTYHPDARLLTPDEFKQQEALRRAAATQQNTIFEQEKALSKGLGEGLSKRINSIAEDGATARQDRIMMQRLQQISTTVEPGTRTALLNAIREKTGISLDANASNVQAFQAALNYLGPRMRTPGSGASSDRDVSIFMNSLPTLLGTAEGNTLAINTLGAMNSYRERVGDLAAQVQLGKIKPDNFEAEVAKIGDPFADFRNWQDKSGQITNQSPTGPPPPPGQSQGQAASQETPAPMSDYDRAVLEKQNREQMRLQQLQQQMPVVP